MTVDIGADTIAVLVGLLTLAIALWAQIWRTGRGIRSDLNERMDGLESKVDDSTKLLDQLKGEVAGRRHAARGLLDPQVLRHRGAQHADMQWHAG